MPDGVPFTYFKIAPQNFDATVYDTDDLSITRGSSLTLLAVPKLLRTHLEGDFPGLMFDWLQSSASELMFRVVRRGKLSIQPEHFKAPDGIASGRWNAALKDLLPAIKSEPSDDKLRQAAEKVLREFGLNPDAEQIERCAAGILKKSGIKIAPPAPLDDQDREGLTASIREFLAKARDNWPLNLLLFGVTNHSPENGASVKDIIGALETGLGVAQLHNMTCLAVPAAVQPLGEKPVCAFTGLYASGSEPEKKRPTSDNAKTRRKIGRKQKSNFYVGVLRDALVAAAEFSGNVLVDTAVAQIRSAQDRVTEFANDFDQIVKDTPDNIPLSLRSNMCVLNMDGNQFAKTRTELADMAAFSRFSRYLDILKAGMLAQVLNWIADTPGMMVEIKDESGTKMAARFETLLWGGDEFTFVAPSWLGWELAGVLHDAVKGWETLDDGTPMCFATGMVFGPHNAPIRDLNKAAMDLTDAAKHDRASARTQVVAYESVDRVHFNPGSYRRDWLGGNIGAKHFSISSDAMSGMPVQVEKVLTTLSRSALHNWYYKHQAELARKDRVDCAQAIETICTEIDRIGHFTEEVFSIQDLQIGDREYPLIGFAQLNLLLDYINPVAGR